MWRSSAQAAVARRCWRSSRLIRWSGSSVWLKSRTDAPGIALAKRLGIPVTHDFRRLLDLEHVDLIIDVSDNVKVWEMLQDFHRMGVTIIGGASAKFMWELIEARIRATTEIEKALNKYQSLYRLYVKETGVAVTDERTRIACEMHDGLVQNLAGVNFKLDLSLQLIRKDPKASWPPCAKVKLS
jgi:Signal transduction histidine kinase